MALASGAISVRLVGSYSEVGGRRDRRNVRAEDVTDFDQAWTRPPIAREREGAAQRRDDHLRRRHRLGALGDVLVVQRRVEGRRDVVLRARRARDNHDQRHAFGEGLGHGAKGVLDARAALARKHLHIVARAQAPAGVGHGARDALLANDDGPDVGGGRVLGERREGVDEERFDPLALHDFGYDVTYTHRDSSHAPVPGARCQVPG